MGGRYRDVGTVVFIYRPGSIRVRYSLISIQSQYSIGHETTILQASAIVAYSNLNLVRVSINLEVLSNLWIREDHQRGCAVITKHSLNTVNAEYRNFHYFSFHDSRNATRMRVQGFLSWLQNRLVCPSLCINRMSNCLHVTDSPFPNNSMDPVSYRGAFWRT